MSDRGMTLARVAVCAGALWAALFLAALVRDALGPIAADALLLLYGLASVAAGGLLLEAGCRR